VAWPLAPGCLAAWLPGLGGLAPGPWLPGCLAAWPRWPGPWPLAAWLPGCLAIDNASQ